MALRFVALMGWIFFLRPKYLGTFGFPWQSMWCLWNHRTMSDIRPKVDLFEDIIKRGGYFRPLKGEGTLHGVNRIPKINNKG